MGSHRRGAAGGRAGRGPHEPRGARARRRGPGGLAVARGLGLDPTRVDETGTPYEEDDTFERIAGAEGDLRGHELVGDDLLDDEEGEEIASEVEGDPLGGQSAEEASMHVVDEE